MSVGDCYCLMACQTEFGFNFSWQLWVLLFFLAILAFLFTTLFWRWVFGIGFFKGNLEDDD